MRVIMRERDVLNQILDYLTIRHVFAFRLNTGSFYDQGRAFRSHSLGPGAADIMVQLPSLQLLWIEVKAPRGRQRPSQKLFEEYVTDLGHRYLIARSIDDLAGVV